MAAKTVYGIWCPDAMACSRGKKMLFKGPSEQNIRDRLYQHLETAACHSDLTEEQRIEMVQQAHTESWEETHDDRQEWREEDSRPEKHEAEPIGKATKRLKPQPPSEAPALARLVESAVAKGIQAGIGAASSSSGAEFFQGQVAVAVPSHGTFATAGDSVTVPRSQIRMVMDHLDRGENAARQAARIANSAALAFDTEANHLASAKAAILTIMQGWQ